jgi:7-cyano-7-deazaguanine reductase
MQPMGKTVKEVLKNIKTTAEKDLSALLETDVKVQLFSQVLNDNITEDYVSSRARWEIKYTNDCWGTLETLPGADKIKFEVFNEDSNLLEVYSEEKEGFDYFRSSLLRSNCKITKQPDSGDIYIYYKGNYKITPYSLLKWIVSFRNECHFHEEICEAAYKRLWDVLHPKELLVTCFYARRGGWDIVPTRANKKSLLDKDLINPKSPYFKFPRQ